MNSQILFYQNPEVKKLALPLIIIITLLFSLLIIAITPPAMGYELSIYDAYPVSFWILVSINIFFSLYMIFRSCDDKTRNWIYGYFSLLLLETIVLLFPIIRGYYSMSRGGGDIYQHLFIASIISNSGYFPQTDIYPIMHILLSVLHISLLDWIHLAILLSVVFFLLYILYLYILGKILLGTKQGGIFISILGIPLIFSFLHFAFIPFFFALVIVPLILYNYQRINTTQKKNYYYICLLFLSLFAVFCHPSIPIFLLFSLIIFLFYEILRGGSAPSQPLKIVSVNIISILIIALSFWFIHFRSLLNTTRKIIQALIGENDTTTIAEYHINLINTADASIWQIIEYYIKLYGPITIYFLISFIFILYLIIQYYQFNKIQKTDMVYSFQFLGALLIGVAMILIYFVIIEPIRAAAYGILFASLIFGIFNFRIWSSIKSGKQKILYTLFLATLLSFICMLCIFNVYSSPWKSSANTALSYGDKYGINWLLEYREEKIPIIREDSGMKKYSNYYYTAMSVRENTNILEYPGIIPSNFGYQTTKTISKTFAYLPYNKVYMVTTGMMKMLPNAVPRERRDRLKKFEDSDFIRLQNDPEAKLIYSNNGLGIWSIDIS